MKCKQVEKIILEDAQKELQAKTKLSFEAHLTKCDKCLRFVKHYNGLRLGLKKLKTPSPSEKLVEGTKMLCYEKLLKEKEVISLTAQKSSQNEAPLTVWIAFILLVGLTLIWAFPVLKDYVEDQLITKHTVYLLMIVVQNILALIFAPILLRIFKFKKMAHRYL